MEPLWEEAVRLRQELMTNFAAAVCSRDVSKFPAELAERVGDFLRGQPLALRNIEAGRQPPSDCEHGEAFTWVADILEHAPEECDGEDELADAQVPQMMEEVSLAPSISVIHSSCTTSPAKSNMLTGSEVASNGKATRVDHEGSDHQSILDVLAARKQSEEQCRKQQRDLAKQRRKHEQHICAEPPGQIVCELDLNNLLADDNGYLLQYEKPLQKLGISSPEQALQELDRMGTKSFFEQIGAKKLAHCKLLERRIRECGVLRSGHGYAGQSDSRCEIAGAKIPDRSSDSEILRTAESISISLNAEWLGHLVESGSGQALQQYAEVFAENGITCADSLRKEIRVRSLETFYCQMGIKKVMHKRLLERWFSSAGSQTNVNL
eukprot:gnl/MRDRNA2_/MRDRNA2_69054_c0_seq1.p1 gnl/MRDRNA2_/MRDRNA2_69054_c0~~gnl/MRDRNA2_/MRDRNA2_69054_c0_seq1.p1  ORF type:complete len:379 (+),score=82.55 gnl/MRDRNA2_/MRDRNA2_69054_c0_seq1:132-1268(+)